MKKVGLALGGGGARGLAHLGVLKVLEKEKIPIDYIAGTSMGSIVGACYAVDTKIEKVLSKIKETLASSMFANIKMEFLREDKNCNNTNFFRKAKNFFKYGLLIIIENTQYSFFNIEKLQELINLFLPDIDINDTKIPFAAVATDITNGKEKVFTKGSLRKCVLASSSIPGVFPPVEIDGEYFCDGGSVNVTPVKVAKSMGADIVIASNVKSRIIKWSKPEKANELINRTNYIAGDVLNTMQVAEADIVVNPAVRHLHWTQFDKIDLMIKKGEVATIRKLDEIKKGIRHTFTDKLKKYLNYKL